MPRVHSHPLVSLLLKLSRSKDLHLQPSSKGVNYSVRVSYDADAGHPVHFPSVVLFSGSLDIEAHLVLQEHNVAVPHHVPARQVKQEAKQGHHSAHIACLRLKTHFLIINFQSLVK